MRKHCSNVCKLRPCLNKESKNSARLRTIVTAALQRQYSQTELIFWISLVLKLFSWFKIILYIRHRTRNLTTSAIQVRVLDPDLSQYSLWWNCLLYTKLEANNYGHFALVLIFFSWYNNPLWARASFLSRFYDHTQTHHTLWDSSARYRDLYLTTYNTKKRYTFMPRAAFELTIPASERPQTNTLVGAANGIGFRNLQ